MNITQVSLKDELRRSRGVSGDILGQVKLIFEGEEKREKDILRRLTRQAGTAGIPVQLHENDSRNL